jgi:hypothetical protein
MGVGGAVKDNPEEVSVARPEMAGFEVYTEGKTRFI